MAAGQALDGQAHEEHAVLHRLVLIAESRRGTATAGTTYKDIALFLVVEVHHHPALQKISRHGLGTCQAGFLVTGEDTLQRAVLNVVGTQDGNLHGTADTVISTQCSTFCLHPVSIHISLYGIVVEVELHIVVLLAHHVHVALQNQYRTVLHTRSGRLADDHIAYLVALGFQTKTTAYFQQVFHHLVLLL